MELSTELNRFKTSFEGDFYFDKMHQALYATDASVFRKLPLAVAFPKNSKSIKKLIAFANEHQLSLIPRTAGTSLAGQCVGEGIVVDVSKYFTQIIDLDLDDRTVTVQPGVIRDELNTYLAPHGLFFGPNTSTSNRCMIGGMVGNNSSGTTSIQYGVTRDKVILLKTLLSDGSEATFKELTTKEVHAKRLEKSLEGDIYRTLYNELSNEAVRDEIRAQFPKPEIHRRNTGYAVDALLDASLFGGEGSGLNVCKLLCGSEGTLAFTTEITLQLDLLPPRETALVAAHYETLDACMNDINTLMQHDLHTCELMDDVILNCTKNNLKYDSYRFFVTGDPKALLLLEIKAEDEDQLQQQLAHLLQTLQTNALSYAMPVLRGEEIEMAMDLRKAGLGLLGNMVGDPKAVACIEDTAVALPDLPAYIAEFTALMKRFQQKAVYYAHAGAGELHLRPILNLKEHSGVAYFRQITSEVAQLTKKYQGSFSGEHGDGMLRAEFIPLLIGKENYQLLQKIKATFDPHQIFNPGKIVDSWPMDQDLRYQPGREEPEINTLMNFDDSEGFLRLAEKCNGSGDCRKTHHSEGAMCPSYQATLDEKDTTRARANVLREVLTNSEAVNKFDSDALKDVFDLCLSCKACASECPSNVDMAVAKAEFQYQYQQTHGSDRATKFFGRSSKHYRLASRFPRLSNAMLKNPWIARNLKIHMGIASQRSLPLISTKTIDGNSKKFNNQAHTGSRKVLLYVDEFTNYLDNEIAQDAYDLLVSLGYSVGIVDDLDSARALISKGFLKEARREVDKNIDHLAQRVSATVPLIGIEPSSILGFRDEFLRLATNRNAARSIADHTFLFEEFIAREHERNNITSEHFTSAVKQIKIHVHCHQKALSNQKVTFDMLNIPKNYTPTLINSGCCGMAGSFGYEADKYELSMKIGELRLFPSIRKAAVSTVIAANGTSCRHQIKDGTQREALHPITILKNALKVF